MNTRLLGSSVAVALALAHATLVATPVRAADCAGGPGSPTTTTIALARVVAPYGTPNLATVRVTSSGGIPTGLAQVMVDGSVAGNIAITNGAGSLQLPQTLAALATHRVTARFVATECFATSAAQTFYTVEKVATVTHVGVRKARKAVFRASVTSATGMVVSTGSAYFAVRRNGRVVTSGTTALRSGVAVINLSNLRRGRYTVRAKYLGALSFAVSSARRSFRVR